MDRRTKAHVSRACRDLLGCAAIAGCVGCGGDAAAWGGTVRDSAGIAIVENTATGTWAAEDVPTVTRELDIGTADGPAETQLGTITGVGVDSDGRILALDTQARTVRVFDAEGTFVRDLGGPGTGPGELSQASAGIIVGAGDTVIVPDPLQQRVNRYAPDGASLGSFPMPLTGGIAIRWDRTPDDQLVHQIRRLPFGPQGGAAPEPEQAPATGDPIVVRALDGAILDTLAVLPGGETLSMSGGQMQMTIFASEPVWDLAPDGRLFSGVNSEFRIRVHGADGTLERIIIHPVEQRTVTESDRDAIRTSMRKFMQEQGLPPQAAEPVLQAMQFADVYPAFATLLAGPEGQLWVQRVRTPESILASGGSFEASDIGSPEWDVFDVEGRYLGVVTLPDRFQPFLARDARLYGVWRDELDVQHVIRLRIDG